MRATISWRTQVSARSLAPKASSEVGPRGYLNEDYRLFHLRDSRALKLDYHYHEFDKLVLQLGGLDLPQGLQLGNLLLGRLHGGDDIGDGLRHLALQVLAGVPLPDGAVVLVQPRGRRRGRTASPAASSTPGP